ncbi:hypothetical protein CORC01_06107 [Colletotrichum orchidophilum]|uniref:Uncharacterized protein n=1 Tax=Colletotrichum orchidophilum TaxID=1209926 RepID=A0A1G4BBE4_9PEZI|nr:uncharacterized protein CORC01_06107 [Colletotrichum orchidophilum]OHE98656.1 hypothetical protein CORC01_06107 [Colletotrichum orchidophilum]
MDPLSALRATYFNVLFAIELDQVPQEVRNSLELVRTCHTDLQYLIEIRNELLPLLQRRPIVLERVNNIVEATHKGLAEVCEILEKSRPRLNNRKTPFRSRLSWTLLDSGQFKGQGPVISRHRESVLAELNFLRQIALLAPSSEGDMGDDTAAKKPTVLFDNVALLGDLMGKANISGSTSPIPANPNDINYPKRSQAHDLLASQALLPVSSGLATMPSAPPLSSISRGCPTLPTDFLFPALSTIDIPKQFLDQESDASDMLNCRGTRDAVIDSLDGDGISLLFGDYANMTPLLSSTPSLSSPSASPWLSHSEVPHRPVSLVSSLSSINGTCDLSNSENPLEHRSPSVISLENQARQHQSTGLDSQSIDGLSVPNMARHAISSRSTSSSTSTPSLMRQFRAWSSPSFSMLSQHKRNRFYQSSPLTPSPSKTMEVEETSSQIPYPSLSAQGTALNQLNPSSSGVSPYIPGDDEEGIRSRATTPAQHPWPHAQATTPNLQQSLRSQTYDAHFLQQKPLHPLSQATSQYSLRDSQVSQTKAFHTTPPLEPEQAQAFEMLGSIPNISQLSNQRQLISHASSTVKRENQNPTSTNSDLGVFELP